jgi:acetyl esterase/lipase
MKPPLLFALLLWFGIFSVAAASEPPRVIELWPGAAPGDKEAIGEENDTTKPDTGLVAGKRVIRLTNVSKPTITIYHASKSNDTGAAVLVCPGGAYRILALDLEGTEVCDWLNSIGVTGVLLKYRVPKRDAEKDHTGPLQDAQRALGLLRHRAKELGLDPKRLGVLGFSAGGHLAASLSNNNAQRNYARIDEADEASCRPDFSLLIYPAYLVSSQETNRLAPEFNITDKTPPTFIAMAADDPVHVENAFYYGIELKKAKVPVEVHIYENGGHGYGLRPRTDLPVTSWPQRATDWMRSRGVLKTSND